VIAAVEDLEAILALQKTAFRDVAIMHNHLDMPPMAQTYEEIKRDYDNGVIFVKVSDRDKIIGSVRGYLDENHICRIGRLVVHPNYQRKGLGKLLMKEIEEIFKHCNEYRIFTSERSTHVISLYESLGYEKLSRETVGSYKIVHMKKANKPADRNNA
jgi:ribosomal protein S18 acetylase RimI-like enzyme